MKKFLCLLMITSILLCLFCGCNTSTEGSDTPESTTEIISDIQIEEESTVSCTEETTEVSLNTTEKPLVLKSSHGEYYSSGYTTFLLNEDDSVSSLKTAEDNSYVGFIPNRSLYDGQTIYAQIADNTSELYKCILKDDKVETEIWVDNGTLNSSVVSEIGRYSGNMRYWQLDGEYIYFICIPSKEYFMAEKSIAYRLGRISKDGSSIEFIGDEIASSYGVIDGWIYFYDNGYTYDEGTSDGYYYNYDRVGIYRMKTDGSQKELIYNDFETDEKDTRNEIIYCDRMNVYGDYIYFIDYSKNGESRVCRIKTDGSDLEYVSQNGAYSYTVDTENDKLYYSSGIFGLTQIEPKTIYEVDISNKIESELFKYGRFNQPEFYVYNDYLYFYCETWGPSDDAENPRESGMRYNLNEGEMKSLYGFVDDSRMPSYYWDEATYYSNYY